MQSSPSGPGRGATSEPGLIELKLRQSAQLFESLDPSPFPGRDLDRDAADFIVAWAREHPSHAPLRIRLHLARPVPEDAVVIAEAVRGHFEAAAESSHHAFRRLMRMGRRSLLIGLCFLAVCLWSAEWLSHIEGVDGVLGLLRESLVIGGWVALWRPLEIFLYEWWPLRTDRRLYQRLSEAAVELV
jgi:hypothetical protein